MVKSTELELEFQKKILDEFDIGYVHAYGTRKNRGLTTFEELYYWYKENIELLERCQEILTPLTDDEVSLLLNIPKYKLEKDIYNMIYRENAYRSVCNRDKAISVLDSVKEYKDRSLTSNDYISTIQDNIKHLSLEEIRSYLGFKLPTIAKSFLIVADSIGDCYLEIGHLLTDIKDRIDYMDKYRIPICRLKLDKTYNVYLVKKLNLILVLVDNEIKYVARSRQTNHHVIRKRVMELIRKVGKS